jgi:hypothetical protein
MHQHFITLPSFGAKPLHGPTYPVKDLSTSAFEDSTESLFFRTLEPQVHWR